MPFLEGFVLSMQTVPQGPPDPGEGLASVELPLCGFSSSPQSVSVFCPLPKGTLFLSFQDMAQFVSGFVHGLDPGFFDGCFSGLPSGISPAFPRCSSAALCGSPWFILMDGRRWKGKHLTPTPAFLTSFGNSCVIKGALNGVCENTAEGETKEEPLPPLQTHLVFLSQQRDRAVLGAGEGATGFGMWSRAQGAWHRTQGQRGPRRGAGDKEGHAGATPQGALATLGA